MAMISPFRAVRALVAAARVVKDPRRLDDVLRVIGQLQTPAVMAEGDARVSRTPWGREALRRGARLGHVDLRELAALPEGTLGRAYAHHMLDLGLDPKSLTEEADRAGWFLRAHMLETHDVWHVVTGFGTDVAGELGLQGFYLGNFPLGGPPLAITAIGLVHALVYARDASDPLVREVVRGYLLGRRAKPLFGVDWKTLWSTPLADVRARFGVDRDPVDRFVEPQAAERAPAPVAAQLAA